MKKRSFFVFPLLATLLACTPSVANRGSMVDLELLAQIKPGETTREEVATKLGSPISMSTVDENVWYYVGRQTEQYSFFSPEVMKQQAIEIDFDQNGVVAGVANLDFSRSVDARPIDRETPTYGQENTFLRQLLGDLSHPRPNMKSDRAGGT